MIKTLLFSSLFPHQGEPSLGIFVERRLSHLLASGGVETRVVAPVPWFPSSNPRFGRWAQKAEAPLKEQRNGVPIWHPRFLVVPKIGMRLTPAAMVRAGRKAIKEVLATGFKPDLIDAHYLYPDGVAAAVLAKEFNLPFVMTARGSDVTEIPDFPFAKSQILTSIDQASHVITVSASLRDGLIELGADGDKITTVRNGVDPTVFTGAGRGETRSRIGLNSPTLLTAGWLIPRKRVDRVIHMLAMKPTYQLLIAGSGPEEGSLKQLVSSLGLTDRVTFLGQIDPGGMPDIMAAADRLVLASEREGWANVLLEAMACGTPVIATDAGGAREFVDLPGGVVSDTANPEGLSKALDVLDKAAPDRADVRAYAQRYDWGFVSDQQKSIFSDAIKAFQDG